MKGIREWLEVAESPVGIGMLPGSFMTCGALARMCSSCSSVKSGVMAWMSQESLAIAGGHAGVLSGPVCRGVARALQRPVRTPESG